MTGNALLVLEAGPQTLVQDRGRPGLAHLGVGASGAFDRAAAGLANRLVGNSDRAAVLEVLIGGLRMVLEADSWVAITGAWGPVTIGARPVEPNTATLVRAGVELVVGPAQHGIRYYVAIRGGVDAEATLYSRSRDVLAALGPSPLAQGQRVPIGSEVSSPIPAVDLVPVDPPRDTEVALTVRPGPRRGWFADSAWQRMLEAAWITSARSDRTGVRLEGPILERIADGELPSEGMVPGAIQVSPDGVPTILGVDAPVTGGYPVIAVVADQSFDALAQLRPGQPLRFIG